MFGRIGSTACSVSLLFMVLLPAACTERSPGHRGETPAGSQGLTPDQVLYGSNILLSERGVKKALIESEYLEKYAGRDSTLMVSIKAAFFDSLGAVTSRLVSDSGFVREKTSWLKVWGNVRVVSDNGVTLEADSLFWDQERDSVTTESFVRITHGDNVQTGYGLQADHRMTSIRIKSRVQGEFEDIDAVERKRD